MTHITALTNVKAVFFDLDDTILDNKERMVKAALRLTRLRGVSASEKSIENLFCSGKEWMDVLKTLGLPLENDVLRQYIRFFMEAHSLSKLQFGVKKALKKLRKRFELLLVTSRWYRTRVEQELEELGVRKFFHQVVTREQAADHFGLAKLPLYPFHRQRKILYEYALRLTGLLPKQVVVVGDSTRELAPARMLGMTAVGVLTGTSSVEELEKVTTYVIATFEELDKLDVFHVAEVSDA